MRLWCEACGDEFSPVEGTETDTPVCSDECADEFWSDDEASFDYELGRRFL